MTWNLSKVLFWLALCWSSLFFSASASADTYPGGVTWGHLDAAVAECLGQSSLCSYEHSAIVQASYYIPSSTGHTVTYLGGQNYCAGGHSVRVNYSSPYGTQMTVNICPTANEPPPPPNPCPAAGSVTYPTALDGGFFVAAQSTPPTTGPQGTSFCLPYGEDLCEVKCTTGLSGPNPIASGYFVACTSLTSSGSVCPSGLSPLEVSLTNPLEVPPDNGAAEPSAPGDCPPGTGFAQVNNESMCLPGGTTGTGSTATVSSGGTVTSSSSDWTVNSDSSITTTTNTTSTTNGETTTSTAQTTTGSNGAISGQGEGVNLGPAPSFVDPGNGGEVSDMVVSDGGLSAIEWHQTFLPEGGSCAIQDIPLTVMGVSVTIPLSAACQYLPIIYGLVVFMSVLASIRMFALAPW